MPTFYPCYRYRDASADIEWLERAFGFTTTARFDGEDGGVEHAELALGDGKIMLGTTREDDPFGDHSGQGWAYVAIDDPDALYERARQAGAEVVKPIADQPHGSRDFSVRDPEGNTWSFGTYRP